MKLNKFTVLKFDAVYLELTLTPTESNWFSTYSKLKALLEQLHEAPVARFIMNDTDRRGNDILYIKVKDSFSDDFTISALQQLLIYLLDYRLITLAQANKLAKYASMIVDTPMAVFIKGNQFFDAKPLTDEQIKALQDLYEYGLRVEHVRAWRQGEHTYFKDAQRAVLSYLIVEKKLNPMEAITEINELTWSGCKALQSLYEYGLRGYHLRPLLAWFNESAMQALISLVANQNVQLETALDEIKKLDSNYWYAVTLQELYSEGLRSEHLLQYQTTYKSGKSNYTMEHHEALIALVKDYHLTPAQAVSEINCLNNFAASAVNEFYAIGLRGSDLRHWKENEGFDEDCHLALRKLHQDNKDVPIQAVLAEVRKLSSSEVYAIAADYLLESNSPSVSLRR